MVERDPLYRVVVDQCKFGLKDPVSHKLYRKTTALDVNKQAFAMGLATATRCNHRPADHEQIRGSVRVDGILERRSMLAGRWTKQFAQYILEAAQVCLAGQVVDLNNQSPYKNNTKKTRPILIFPKMYVTL